MKKKGNIRFGLQAKAISLVAGIVIIVAVVFSVFSINCQKNIARIGMSHKNINQMIEKNKKTTVLLTLSIVIMSVFLTNLLVKKLFVHAIYQLLSAVQAIGRGELKSEIKIKTKNEFGELAAAFKEMQVELLSLSEQAKTIASGDLTEDLGFGGELAASFNVMSENLRSLIRQINDTSSKLDIYSNELLSTAEEQSSGATQLASLTSEVSAAIGELTITAKQISVNVDLVTRVAEGSLTNAHTGKSAVSKSAKGMEAIKTSTRESASRITVLGQKSQKISDIIEIINQIFEQTKLLALNASIEATRAGEAGKGFSVVAGEIRRLSENSAESLREVKDIIREIQSSINISVLSSEKMEKTVDNGLFLSKEVAESLEGILRSVEETADYAKQIRHSTQQQKTASEQVAVTIREMASGSKQAADVAELTATTAGKQTELSAELKKVINRFKF